MIALFVSALLLAQQTPPTEAPVLSDPPAAEKPRSNEDPDRMVCRSERIVGSNRSERVCMTARQREEMRANARDMRDRRDDNAGAGQRYQPSTSNPEI